jgi:hypothetical protein
LDDASAFVNAPSTGSDNAGTILRRSVSAVADVRAHFVPLVHLDDHPQADLEARRMRTSVPKAIEDFVRERVPGAKRIEMCHDGRRAVIRHGWQPIAEGCRPRIGDRVVDLDGEAE